MTGYVVLIGVLFLVPMIGCTQESTPKESTLDNLIPVLDQPVNYEDRYETLAQLLTQRFEINHVTLPELQAIPGLTDSAAWSLISYREKFGPLLSAFELQAVPGWNHSLFESVRPFLYVRESQSRLNTSILKRMKEEQNNYLIIRTERTIEQKKGYDHNLSANRRYAGTPDRIYLRYRNARPGDFSVGFTAEKDQGEELKWDPAHQQYGPDFLSFHLQLIDKGRWKNLIVGDFQGQFGQGLILGSVFGFGKNSETITSVRRSSLGFIPYTSVQENQLFRGMGGSYSLSNRITIHAFISKFSIDSQVVGDSTGTIGSLPETGLHRTSLEQMQRKQTARTDGGLVIQFKDRLSEFGVIWQETSFGDPLKRQPSPYNQFAFEGDHNQNLGIYGSLGVGQALLFGELSSTLGHGTALNIGTLAAIRSTLQLSVHFRYYAPDFYSFHSNAFTEGTSPQNEQGVYWGWKYNINSRLTLTGYLDIFEFPWLRYRLYRPSEGSEWMVRLSFKPTKTVNSFIQFRQEIKSRNAGTFSTYHITEGIRRNAWIHCDFQPVHGLQLRTRVQFNSYEIDGQVTSGLALIQDLSFALSRFNVAVRYALFDTDFENRVYTYEKDVWMSYAYPAYEGKGIRTCILAQYDLTRKINLCVRWARTLFADRTYIGSGLEEIEGDTRNDVKFQLRISF